MASTTNAPPPYDGGNNQYQQYNEVPVDQNFDDNNNGNVRSNNGKIAIGLLAISFILYIVTLSVNETGFFSADFGQGCTGSDHCRWTDLKTCWSGCSAVLGYSDGCSSYDYGSTFSGTRSGNSAAFAFNIIGLLLVTLALMIIFIGTVQQKCGTYLRQIVGSSALCALIAILAISWGNSGTNECWDNPLPGVSGTSSGPGLSFYGEIVLVLVLIVAGRLIHREFGNEAPTDYVVVMVAYQKI